MAYMVLYVKVVNSTHPKSFPSEPHFPYLSHEWWGGAFIASRSFSASTNLGLLKL